MPTDLVPKYREAALARVVAAAIYVDCKSAVSYESPDCVIRATHQHKPYGKRVGGVWLVVHIGKPNYAERQFIKCCQKSGEPFPVKGVQYKYYPVAKVVAKRVARACKGRK